MVRPIITFVKFREHQHDVLSLGDAALCNIPHQDPYHDDGNHDKDDEIDEE
jgi:hypothetical protein